MRALLLIALACLDREGMRLMIRKQLRPVRACYARALQTESPGLHGKLQVRAVIGPLGTITSASIESAEFGAPKFQQCVLDAVRGWRFPRPPPGTPDITLIYPFDFRPR